MTHSISQLQADFDRIAQFEGNGWNHNSHYHDFLLKHVPQPCSNALEIGCGTGTFARLLASRAERVLALDLSAKLIQIAKERSKAFKNIAYLLADVTSCTFPAQQFDCIVSIATLHHMPLEQILNKIKPALKVGGTLIVLDLYQAEGMIGFLTELIAIPANFVLTTLKHDRMRRSKEEVEAWAEHGKRDRYSTLQQVRHACRKTVPGAEVRRHLFWRYSLIWKKGQYNES